MQWSHRLVWASYCWGIPAQPCAVDREAAMQTVYTVFHRIGENTIFECAWMERRVSCLWDTIASQFPLVGSSQELCRHGTQTPAVSLPELKQETQGGENRQSRGFYHGVRRGCIIHSIDSAFVTKTNSEEEEGAADTVRTAEITSCGLA